MPSGSTLLSMMLQPVSPRLSGEFSTQVDISCAPVVIVRSLLLPLAARIATTRMEKRMAQRCYTFPGSLDYRSSVGLPWQQLGKATHGGVGICASSFLRVTVRCTLGYLLVLAAATPNADVVTASDPLAVPARNKG